MQWDYFSRQRLLNKELTNFFNFAFGSDIFCITSAFICLFAQSKGKKAFQLGEDARKKATITIIYRNARVRGQNPQFSVSSYVRKFLQEVQISTKRKVVASLTTLE